LKVKMPDRPVIFICMNILANSYAAAGRTQKAIELGEEVLRLREAKLGPNHPDTLTSMNILAWTLVTASDAKFHNPPRAIELAEKAVKASPKNPDFLGTLGTARYRAGDSSPRCRRFAMPSIGRTAPTP
jgi:tetratricopeptide (TPR) repeat protein